MNAQVIAGLIDVCICISIIMLYVVLKSGGKNTFPAITAAIKDIAAAVVGKLEQTAAKELREAVKDGKIDRAELLALGETACKEIINFLLPETLKILKSYIKSPETYIKNIMETELLKLKDELGKGGE